jgi:putative aminopeptidase
MTMQSRLVFVLFGLVCVGAAQPAMSQYYGGPEETPAVSGYEQQLTGEIRKAIKGYSPQTDNLGNVYVTLGSGAPHRLIVAPIDQPGYVVSAITSDGTFACNAFLNARRIRFLIYCMRRSLFLS